MSAQPYTDEELQRWRESYPEPPERLSNDHAMWAARYDQRFLATIDADRAELARYKAFVSAMRDDGRLEPDAANAELRAELARLRAVPADVAGLVAALRGCPGATCACRECGVIRQAADALEAQARKLAEADAERARQWDALTRMQTASAEVATRAIAEKDARIAELTAQVKAAREALERVVNAAYLGQDIDVNASADALAKLDGKKEPST